MLGSILGGFVIWFVGSHAIYSGLQGRRILPSDFHVRVVAVTWPFLILFGLGWIVWKVFRLIPRQAKETVVAFQTVADWRYHEGRLLPASTTATKDSFYKEAELEVADIAPDHD